MMLSPRVLAQVGEGAYFMSELDGEPKGRLSRLVRAGTQGCRARDRFTTALLDGLLLHRDNPTVIKARI